MILDEVLNEEAFNQDDMVDIFVEGFLYALEMQEEGKKASSIKELSENLSEAADVAISELSHELMMKASGKAMDKGIYHAKKAADPKISNKERYEHLLKSGEHSKQATRIYAKMTNLDAKRYCKRGNE